MTSVPRRPPDVLIVGAGPVGLVLGCELVAAGVDVRVVERSTTVRHEDAHSRAILLVPRALELLDRIGVGDRLVARGRPVGTIGYYSEGRLLGRARFADLPDTPYPFLLALPQRDTEDVLRRRFAELGGTVERGVTVEELTDPAHPRVLLRHADGTPEVVRPRWLVGADGAGSTTRGLLGLRLGGDPTDVSYVIADAPLSGAVPAHAQYYYSRNGLLAVIPMGDGLYRLAGNVPHDEQGGPDRWRAILQDAVDARAHAPLTVGEPTYARLVRPRCGQAGAMWSGRCFLVGDAAHVITPAGGQGMNLGIQDAVNLGWKLAGVALGRLEEAALDTYGPERAAAAARTSTMTARIVGLAGRRSRAAVAARDAAFALADRTGLVQRVLTPLLGQLDVDYGGGRRVPRLPGRARAVPGLRVPLPAAGPADGGRHTVLLWPGHPVPVGWDVRAAALRRRLADRATVVDGDTLPPAAVAALRRALGRGPRMATVRPDGHLVGLAGTADVDAVLRQLAAAGSRPDLPTALPPRATRERAVPVDGRVS